MTLSVDGDESRAYGTSPSISGDGNVVAFESGSRALIEFPPPTGNLAQIYVLDLSTGEMTHESRSDAGQHANRRCRAPRLSFDGRYVAFGTSAVTLVAPLPGAQRAISLYLRDRVEGTTVLASPARDGLECGPLDARFPCRMDSVTSHSLSSDGRYAAFATRGTNLLPGSDHKGDQVYIFDQVTGRLRRTGIDDSGTMGNGCSVEPALSGNGEVVAYRTNSSNLAAGIVKSRRDVVQSNWQCLENGNCRVPSSCPPTPQVCAPASRARLVLLKSPPGGQREDKFMFRWQADPLAENFPDPTADAAYQFCLYAGETPVVEFDLALPTDSWRARSREFRIRNGGSGLSVVTLRNGDARSRITLKGKGALLDAPYLPVVAPQGLTVQLIDADSGRCFGADFPASSITRNHPGDPSSQLGRVGRLAAKFP